MKVPIKIKREVKCLHKNKFHRMSYEKIPAVGTGLDSLDIDNPVIETICADCGKDGFLRAGFFC